MRAVPAALVNGTVLATNEDGVSVRDRYVPPPVVIQEPLLSLKHPELSCIPLLNVLVADPV